MRKNPGGHRQTGHHQVLLGPEVGLAHEVRGNQGLGGDVAHPEILFQGQVDEAVEQRGSRKDGHQSKSSVQWMVQGPSEVLGIRCLRIAGSQRRKPGRPRPNRGSGHKGNAPGLG